MRACARAQLDRGILGRACLAVGPIGRHRAPGVASADDARGEGNLLAGEPVRIPGAVPAPTSQVSSSGGLLAPLPVVALLSSSSARIQVTPLGSGSRWQIDDVYIDPAIQRIG